MNTKPNEAMNHPADMPLFRPAIVLGQDQARRLAGLAEQALDRAPDIAGRLYDEIERAQLVVDDELPDDVVAMEKEIDFVDESSGQRRTVRLVWPADADIANGRVSILTPVGTGLIGLRKGDAIDWRVQDGSTRRLRIIAVRPGSQV